jgi:hypothetical protein
VRIDAQAVFLALLSRSAKGAINSRSTTLDSSNLAINPNSATHL